MQENSCRICLTSHRESLKNLFQNDDGCSYAKKIMHCSGIKVQQGDMLPQMICIVCLNQILLACDIKDRCIQTDRNLRRTLKNDSMHLLNDHEEVLDIDILGIENQHTDNAEIKNEYDQEDQKLCKAFKSPPKLRSEQTDNSRRKSKLQDFRCFFCDKVFEKISSKKDHIKVDHASELICKVCNTRKQSSIATEKCLKDHKFGFDYLCQICAKPFRHKCYLIKHQTTCHSESSTSEIFTCDYCGLCTKYKMNLYRHIKSVHLNITRRFACPYNETCTDMVYTTKEGLNIHLYRVHDVPAPVNCGSCQLGFSFISELKIHRRICGGISRKPRVGNKNKNFRTFCEVTSEGYRCKVCQKVFAEKQNWSYHYSAYHRDNRTCEICSKEFTCYTNFLRHVNVHHRKIKNFHCDYPGCGKSFGQKGALINHKNTHTGEKPFACSLCNFRSGDKTTIAKHKKKVHSSKVQT